LHFSKSAGEERLPAAADGLAPSPNANTKGLTPSLTLAGV